MSGSTASVEVLIPTRNRPAALAVTLAGLVGQHPLRFDVVIADQSDGAAGYDHAEVRSVLRVLELQGCALQLRRNLPRRGMAQQRHYLLQRSRAPYLLFLDDDVLLEPGVVGRLLAALRQSGCGFVGNALIGPSYRDDIRPQQQAVEFWDGPVRPEHVTPHSLPWLRHHLHSAANILHVQKALRITTDRPRLYKVAWVGGCVLYDARKLRTAGGFSFWRQLPADHCGEDVLAQLRVMARFGGCGLMPSGAFHLELPTTLPQREVDAPKVLPVAAMPQDRSASAS